MINFNDDSLPQALIASFAALMVIVILVFIGFVFITAFPTFMSQGLYFFTGQKWDYESNTYGSLNVIAGTLILTLVTIILACPTCILTAIYLSEFAPKTYRNIARPMIELLVGIPSVVYGIFGLFIVEPVFASSVYPSISGALGFIPIFHQNAQGSGNGILLASSILAIMIAPTIIAISEESIRSVPQEYREASYAIGATKWETVVKVVLPSSLTGIVTGVILGMMRAMGETMAVIMLMGNNPQIPTSILDKGYAITSKILCDAEAHIVVDEYRSAIFALAATLFMMEALLLIATRCTSRSAK